VAALILIVEDEKILAESMSVYLEHHGYSTVVAHSGEDGLRLAGEASPDVAVLDVRLPGIDGLEVLKRLRELSPTTAVIMATAHASVTSAVEAMKRGAFDYLNKPVDLDELKVVVDKALGHLRLSRELSYLKARGEAGAHVWEIVGDSPPVRTLREQVERIATLESPGGEGAPTVLLLGETGTGKGLVARAIHYRSARASGPFVDINCAAIPPALLEAELFGYERGAYTDARTAKPGLFEAAEGGTIFLDEIGHMDPALQVKLLKALEDKAVRRLGGLRTKAVKARIIAATNRDLEAAIAEGAFRQDLYFRIKVLTIEIPPVRARGADITLLARHFLDVFAKRYAHPPKTLGADAEAALLAYSWPGNVRELAHLMERVVLLHSGPIVRVEDLGLTAAKAAAPVVVEPGGRVQVDFTAGRIALDDVERELIEKALQASNWNRAQAADLLGLSRDTLRYRIEKYQLQSPTRPSSG
jgi:two-component system, NtrC family, response regulator AtoC